MKKYIWAFSIFLFVPLLVLAATFQAGDMSTVSSGQNIQGNLYAAGGNVSILGNVENGDLYAAGGNVLVQGDVAKDAGVVGGTVNVLGGISDDLRVAGGNVTINSKIGGELLAAGGQLVSSSGANVRGAAKISGGSVNLEGNFEDSLEVAGGTVTLNGTFAKDVKVIATDKLLIGDQAVIGGQLDYRSKAEAQIAPGAKIAGEKNFQKIETPRGAKTAAKATGGFFAFLSVWWFIKFIIMFVAALILSAVMGQRLQTLVAATASNIGPRMLIGLGALVLMPVALMLLLITIIGILPAVFGFIIYAGLLVLASVTKPILVGSWVYKIINRRDEYQIDWKVILLGVFIFQVLRYIPILGGIFDFVIMLAALGAWTNLVYMWMFKSKDSA